MNELKTCKGCGEERSREEFYDNPSLKDGKNPYCNDCHKKMCATDKDFGTSCCPVCEKEFSLEKSNQKYCSIKCRRRARYQRSKKEIRECRRKHCENTFKAKSRSKQKYCSRVCAAKSLERNAIVECDECGRSFKKKLSDIEKTKHDYCSYECFTRARESRVKVECDYCGKEHERVRSKLGSHKYCSRSCFRKAKKEEGKPKHLA